MRAIDNITGNDAGGTTSVGRGPVFTTSFSKDDAADGRAEVMSPAGEDLAAIVPLFPLTGIATRRPRGLGSSQARVSGHGFQLAVKRLVDIVGALGGLVVLAPLLIVTSLLIKLDSPGPVFFRQIRTGRDGVPFEILKFRSMRSDACDRSGVAQTTSGDQRVTSIGRVLRRTNIDELPQLINVLRGDMSLVGPRPHVPGMLAAGRRYEDLVPGYGRRHRMRPGITGLAQSEGWRGPTTDARPAIMRVMCDFAYIRDFSLWLDFRIMVRTVARELRGGSGF